MTIPFPEALTNSGPLWFVGELVLVVLLLSGMVFVWSEVRPRLVEREPAFWVMVAEAVLVVPWLLFPAMFGLALLDAYRPALLVVQAGLVLAGVAGLWRARAAMRPPLRGITEMVREHWVNVLALGGVALFVIWGWSMPFPEALNGHSLGVLSRVSEQWNSGGYPILQEAWVGYDTQVLVGAAHQTFFLSIFATPAIDSIGVRPIFLLPGLFALLTLQMLRAACREFTGRAEIGSVAFLLATFSYYGAWPFSQITADMFSALIVVYMLLHLGRWVFGGERSLFPFFFALAFTTVVRPQVFLLGIALVALALLVRIVPWRAVIDAARTPSIGRNSLMATAIALPVAAWVAFVSVRYGSPVYPSQSNTGRFGLFHVDDLLNARIEGRSLLLTEFFPAFVSSEVGSMMKYAFTGASFSIVLTLSFVGFMLMATRLSDPERARMLRRIAVVALAAFLVILYLVFPTYPKYSGYGAFLLAPFAAMFIMWLADRTPFRLAVSGLILLVFLIGVGSWANNTWGHAASDSVFTNAKYLIPDYGTPVDRLARSTVRTPASLVTESDEYIHALDNLEPGEHILFLDLEPGALIPSLLDREYLGDEPYLQTPVGQPILDATDDRELQQAFDDLGVQYVYRLGRGHPGIEQTLIMRRLATYDGPETYVIPVSGLVHTGD